MRRIIFFITMLTLGSTPVLRGEDAATEERLNQLSGKIEDLIASQEAQRKRVAELAREIEHLREQQSKPNGSYASQEDLKRLAKAVEEVDRKRLDDNEKTRAELVKLGKSLAGPLTAKSKPAGGSATAPSGGATAEKPTPQEKGFGDYTVQPGDTLSVIVQAYREKNIKLTVDQILKANPGLKPEKLKVGQKIWIPAPQT
jgi:LysM repeat protein